MPKLKPNPNPPEKPLKPLRQFLREDAPFSNNSLHQFIKTGEIRTVRIGSRQYVDMQHWRAIIAAGSAND